MAFDISSPTGAETKRISPSPRVPVVKGSRPTKPIKIGEITELMTMAGTAESMPAANIHSASRRAMWIPKCRLVMDHQAKTGVANPISHAGRTTSNASSIVQTLAPTTVRGSKQTVEIPTPRTNNNQRCKGLGISRGAVERKRWCWTLVAPGDLTTIPPERAWRLEPPSSG